MNDNILNLIELLAPITKKHPAGVNLRTDISHRSQYYKLKDARAAARTAERQKMLGTQEHSNALEHWDVVYAMSVEVLKSKSKDLEIVAWLIEALLRKHGFSGLRDGFGLAEAMIDHYWDDVYPLPDEEDGVIARIVPFVGLNGGESEGTLIVPMANILLTEGGSKGSYTFWQYQKAREIELIQDPIKKQQRIDQSGVSMENFTAAVSETNKDFYKRLVDDLNGSIEAFTNFSAKLESKCRSEVFPASYIRNKLRDCLDCVKAITANLTMDDDVQSKQGAVKLKALVQCSTAVANGISKSGGQVDQSANEGNFSIKNREQALQMLLSIARFFRITEPHSPLPYILERAVKWGKMPLTELLNEIISDETARNHIRELIGVK